MVSKIYKIFFWLIFSTPAKHSVKTDALIPKSQCACVRQSKQKLTEHSTKHIAPRILFVLVGQIPPHHSSDPPDQQQL